MAEDVLYPALQTDPIDQAGYLAGGRALAEADLLQVPALHLGLGLQTPDGGETAPDDCPTGGREVGEESPGVSAVLHHGRRSGGLRV